MLRKGLLSKANSQLAVYHLAAVVQSWIRTITGAAGLALPGMFSSFTLILMKMVLSAQTHGASVFA
jgi:hypothetical protein